MPSVDRVVRRAGATPNKSSCSTAATASCTAPRCSELLGAWPEALVEARHACDRLAAPVNPAALAGACAIEGDLLRLVGDFDGAEAAYQRASEYGRDPQPGLALLRLAQGRLDAADAMIRRVLGEAAGPDLAGPPARPLRRDRARRRRHRRRPRRRRGAP